MFEQEQKARVTPDGTALIQPSAGFLTKLFLKGLCSLRMARHKWRAFTQEIGAAMDNYQQPAPAQMLDHTLPAMAVNASPMVTILDSTCPELPIGATMTLHEANELVKRLDAQVGMDGEALPVTFQIDFLTNGAPDRYQIEQTVGGGDGSLLDHMKQNVARFAQHARQTDKLFDDIPAPYRETLRAQFTAFTDNAIRHVSQKLIPYFEVHCALSAMRQQPTPELEAVPGMAEYVHTLNEQINSLRTQLNRSALGEMEPEQTAPEPAELAQEEPDLSDPQEQAAPEPAEPPQRDNKPSVRGWVAQCKQENAPERCGDARNKNDIER